jgi:glycosyltransferase involved in cell wall biosynthesis
MRNEAANVPQFYRELRSVLQRMGRPYEIIVIDDGSQDETFARLAALQATDPALVVIRFRRNFGQTAAFAAA